MDRLFSLVPKGLLAALIVGAGILYFVLLYDPPHTVCESQLEIFREAQKHFLFLDEARKAITTTKYQSLIRQCRSTNNPGGCYELFEETKMMLRDLQAVPSDCLSRAGDIEEVKTALKEMIDLLVRLAWGEKAPATYYEKFAWLDTADISLYCKLQQQIKDTYGTKEFEDFRERMFQELPGADKMSRNDIWDMTIFSVNCGRYP